MERDGELSGGRWQRCGSSQLHSFQTLSPNQMKEDNRKERGLSASFLLLQNIILRVPFVKQLNTYLKVLRFEISKSIYRAQAFRYIVTVFLQALRERIRGRESSAGLKRVLVTVQLNKQMFLLFFYCESTGIQQLSQDICSQRPRLNLHPIGVLLSPVRPAGAVR